MCTNVHTDGGFTRSRGGAETGILVPEVEEVHALTREETTPDPEEVRDGRKRPTIGKSESAGCATAGGL